MAQQDKHARIGGWDFRGIEVEAFAAGVLAIVLVLACVRAYFPVAVLHGIGVVAFFGMLTLGFLSVRREARSHIRNDFLLELAALYAIVWIAAGRLSIAGL